MASEMTDVRIATMVAMLEQARRAHDPLVRAQILAESQYQVAWALREAVVDCQDDGRRSWAEIGKAIGLPRETAWRQFKAGGPLVTVKPYQAADSPLADSQPRPFADDHALYAFRSEDGNWFGPEDLLEDQCGTGWLTFDPPNAPGSKFAGEELLARYGPWDGDVSFHAPLIRETDSGNPIRVRATYEVIDWLFGDGQTALRQAMTAVNQAAAVSPPVSKDLAELVEKAATAMNLDGSAEEFIAAARQVADAAVLGYRAGLQLAQALQGLERAVGQHRTWAARHGKAAQ
ncbi:MAG TPA: AsnC family protein [Streptosporangiaceae bacterium]|nr:AsnC family protein [Streptosporangiaceae bacterium]